MILDSFLLTQKLIQNSILKSIPSHLLDLALILATDFPSGLRDTLYVYILDLLSQCILNGQAVLEVLQLLKIAFLILNGLLLFDFLGAFFVPEKSEVILLVVNPLDLLLVKLDFLEDFIIESFEHLMLNSHDSKVVLLDLEFFGNLFVFQFDKVQLSIEQLKLRGVLELSLLDTLKLFYFVSELVNFELHFQDSFLPSLDVCALEIDFVFDLKLLLHLTLQNLSIKLIFRDVLEELSLKHLIITLINLIDFLRDILDLRGFVLLRFGQNLMESLGVVFLCNFSRVFSLFIPLQHVPLKHNSIPLNHLEFILSNRLGQKKSIRNTNANLGPLFHYKYSKIIILINR